MRHGICLTAVYPEAMQNCSRLIKLIREVSKQGIYDCVEFYFEGTKEEEREIQTVLSHTDIRLVYHAGYRMKRDRLCITASSELQRIHAVQEICSMYESACRMGADKMLILSGPAEEGMTEDVIIQQAKRSLKEIDRFCGSQLTEITLEFFATQREPYFSLGSTERVREVFQDEKWSHIAITYDTSHVIQLKEDVRSGFMNLKEWIHHVHLSNSMSIDQNHELYGDKHPLFSLENGDFPLEKIRSIYWEFYKEHLLDKVDICSVEVISRGNEEEYNYQIRKEAEYIWKQEEI